ncbi:phage minor structural protein GP20 [uncultured Mediterranean phage MEDS2 group]|nr:phage minor structural protein GP20 [uncultured Mediterranean phage MEDS2 group]
MEEQVIQETPVASSEQPVAETTNTVNIDVSAYEQQIQALQQRASEAEEKFQGIKGKLDDVYKKQDDQRRKTLEDQGQWKDLWEEANKTAQGKDQQIADLQRQLDELRSSNETAAMKTSALSAISQAGAINAEQMLRLVQSDLKKSDDGSVKVLDGGVEQDINVYLAKLKNPGSGYEHHFKPSTQAGMGAKPTTGTAGAAGIANPWLEGSMNLTKQMALEATDPDLAAVLKREAGK